MASEWPSVALPQVVTPVIGGTLEMAEARRLEEAIWKNPHESGYHCEVTD